MSTVPAAAGSWPLFGGRGGVRPAGVAAVAAVGVAAVGGGWALSTPKLASRRKLVADRLFRSNNVATMCFASMSMAAAEAPVEGEEIVEPTTGMTFPNSLEEGRLFTGAGLRKKSILGLKKLNIYTYGVYVDPASLKSELGDKYSGVDPEELRKDEEFFNDIMDREVALTVRLVIVYGSLKIGSVRSAFEDSVGSRIKKFGGAENRELLNSFTGAFTDDIKLPKGTTIDLTRLPGNTLRTKINGVQVGSVESALVCRSLFDLYIGDDPFDKDAKKSIGSSMASLLTEQ